MQVLKTAANLEDSNPGPIDWKSGILLNWATVLSTLGLGSQSFTEHIYIILLKSVDVSKLQVAILARSSREMSRTVRIDWMHIMSWVRVSVWPSNFFIREKHTKPRETRSPSRVFIWMKQGRDARRQQNRPSRFGATDPSHSANLKGSAVCACVRACARDVFSIFDNNIWPRLIMITITIIILYFIQIRHTDDFSSTGTRLV